MDTVRPLVRVSASTQKVTATATVAVKETRILPLITPHQLVGMISELLDTVNRLESGHDAFLDTLHTMQNTLSTPGANLSGDEIHALHEQVVEMQELVSSVATKQTR